MNDLNQEEQEQVERAETLIRELTNVEHDDMSVDGENLESDEENLRKSVNQVIKNSCIQVAIASFAASAPGVAGLAAFTLGVAASGVVVQRIQSEMVTQIAQCFGQQLDSATQARILILLSGISQGSATAATEASRLAAREATRAVANQVANEASRTLVISSIPFIGAFTNASLNTTTTYVIGQRAKVYFEKGPEQLDSWSDSVRAVTGVDERKLSTWIVQAWKLFKASVANRIANSKNAAVAKMKAVKTAVAKRLSFRR